MSPITVTERQPSAEPDGRFASADAEAPSEPGASLPVRRDLAAAYVASLLIAALIAGVSAAGLAFGRGGLYGPDPTAAAGIAASTAGILIPGFFAHDLFNLAVALPVLLATVWLASRGSLVGLLLWPGALFYTLYTYTQYLLGAPFGPLFVGHILLVVLSAYATIGLVASIDADAVGSRLAGAVPARTTGGLLIVLALLTLGVYSYVSSLAGLTYLVWLLGAAVSLLAAGPRGRRSRPSGSSEGR